MSSERTPIGTLQLAAWGVFSSCSENSETAPGLENHHLASGNCGNPDVNLPVLRGHALDTSANADLDHAGLDLVDDVDASLETRRALAVEGADGSGLGEASDEGSGAHLGSTTAGGKDGADGDILDQGRVDLGALKEGLEGAGDEVGSLGVLEATLATLCEGRSESCGDDDLGRRGLLERLIICRYRDAGAYIVGVLLEELLLVAAAGELASQLSQSLEGCSNITVSIAGNHREANASYSPPILCRCEALKIGGYSQQRGAGDVMVCSGRWERISM